MNASAHILVVDDEPDIVEVLRRYLATQGYTVSTATDGSAMRRVMAATPVDLVLLDLGLPGEDGLALMRSLRVESSAACAARSKPIRSIPSSSSRCGARATCSRRRSSADESTPSGGAAALR